MNTKKNSTIAICLTAVLALSPVASFAQATTTFSGEAVALRANALGISLALSDTGPLAASGGNLNTSLASVNVLGLASADALKSTTSGSGTSSQSQSSVASLNLLSGLVTADVVKSNSSATCSGGQAAVSGNAELVGLVAAGQSVLVSNPNLAISLPDGISIVAPEQEIVCARCSSGFTQSTQSGEFGNRTHRRGDDGKPEFRPFSRMAAECRWQASRLDVCGQRRRESRDSFALR